MSAYKPYNTTAKASTLVTSEVPCALQNPSAYKALNYQSPGYISDMVKLF